MVIDETLPTNRHHGWKFIRFGPDGLLYIPVGVPYNVCLREDKRYSSILSMKPDGIDLAIFAHGVRNTVGFDRLRLPGNFGSPITVVTIWG